MVHRGLVLAHLVIREVRALEWFNLRLLSTAPRDAGLLVNETLQFVQLVVLLQLLYHHVSLFVATDTSHLLLQMLLRHGLHEIVAVQRRDWRNCGDDATGLNMLLCGHRIVRLLTAFAIILVVG